MGVTSLQHTQHNAARDEESHLSTYHVGPISFAQHDHLLMQINRIPYERRELDSQKTK